MCGTDAGTRADDDDGSSRADGDTGGHVRVAAVKQGRGECGGGGLWGGGRVYNVCSVHHFNELATFEHEQKVPVVLQ